MAEVIVVRIDASAIDPLLDIASDLDDLLELIPEWNAPERDEIAQRLMDRLMEVARAIRATAQGGGGRKLLRGKDL